MDWLRILFGLGAALMTVGPALPLWIWARRRGRAWRFLGVVALIAGTAWWIDAYLVVSAAGDLGGIMDCYPDCSTTQDAATGVLGYAPTIMAAVLVGLLLGGVTRRLWRARVSSAIARRP